MSYPDQLYYTYPSYRDSLYHHGILGQKWGIRRYQNSDGSLTEAGKKHYAKLDTKWAAKNSEKIRKKTAKKIKRDLDKYNKQLSKQPGYLTSKGKVSKNAINAYNKKMAELMNEKVGDIRSPSGKVVRFVAKRGDVGVYTALATEGYNMNNVKNGVWVGGRRAYRQDSLDTIDV